MMVPDIDECDRVASPRTSGEGICENGGTCVNEIGDYRCDCANGYSGKHCKIGNNN